MTENVAKDIVGIAGLGLAAHYTREMATGHPRDPAMVGGLTPNPASTGDLKHDAAMQAGRFATNWGIAHWLLLPLWKAYAIGTGIGLYWLGHDVTHINVLWLGIVIWAVFQIGFLWFWSRVFDGHKRKRVRQNTYWAARHAENQRRLQERPTAVLIAAQYPEPQTPITFGQTPHR